MKTNDTFAVATLGRLKKHRQFNLSKIIIGMACAITLGACASPVTQSPTGRNQLMLFSEAQINAAAMDAYTAVKASSTLITSGPRYDAVARVGRAVAGITGRDDYKWEFILINQDTVVNAWCMPGGKVAVYTGLLPVARDEGGLAAVIGHEIGHAIAQHSNERASYGEIQNVLGSVLESRLGSAQSRGIWMTIFGVGSTVGFELPFSRKQESEADEIGITLMARAGYHPSAAAEIWDRMAESNRGGMPKFLSTHPDPAARAAALRTLLPAAMLEYEAAPVKRRAAPLP